MNGSYFKKKKIVFFTPSLDVGGIENVFITYANYMANKEYLVSYVCCRKNGLLEKNLSSKIIIYNLGDIKLRNSLIPIVRILKKIQPDYLISGGDLPNIIAVIATFFLPTIRSIVSHHNYPNIEHKHNHQHLLRVIYNKAFKVISVSHGIAQYLQSIGIKEEKITTIYNPIDVKQIISKSHEKLDININNNYLIFVGRLSPVKNLSMMLKAFCLVKRKCPNLQLIIVGDGPEKETLVNQTTNLNLLDDVVFTGALSNPFPLISSSKAVLLPSLSEALPTIILESFVLGIPVVATPTNGAIDPLSNGYYGYLSPSITSSEDFAETIIKALTDAPDENLLKKRALEFSVENKATELCDCF